MVTLSLAMIVKNEASVLARCLDCIKHIVDEIIIVDTGSTDETKELAKNYTNKIYDFQWINDFSAARNYAFDQATSDYIMWLDADDIIDEENQQKLLALKASMDGSVDLYMLKYHVAFDQFGNVTFTNNRERIFKRAAGFRWMEPVHEVIAPRGNIKREDIAIIHGEKQRTHSNRNLEIYEAQENLTPRGMYYFARELNTHGQNERAIEYFEKFLADGRGWKEDCINACFALSDLYHKTGKEQQRLTILFKTFEYDVLRPQICCKIGEIFLERFDYDKAKYWYELALRPMTIETDGFLEPDYNHYIPLMQLCLVEYRLRNVEKSFEYLQKAAAIKPEHPSVKFNIDYFTKHHPQLLKA